MRIASLLPSATEIVCGIGLADQLVAVTHECDFPKEVARLPRVTRSKLPQAISSSEIDQLVKEQLEVDQSLYYLDTEVLRQVRPDLIITQTLCEVCAVNRNEVDSAIHSLDPRPKVLDLEPTRLSEVLESILSVGVQTGCESQAINYVQQLESRVQLVAQNKEKLSGIPTVALLEWIDPLYTAGHWNPELIQLAGGQDLFGNVGARSRQIKWNDLTEADPDYILIACCGFSIQRTLQEVEILQSRPDWRQLNAVKRNQVFVADGSSYFNRPGPRLVDSLEIVSALLSAAENLPNQACIRLPSTV